MAQHDMNPTFEHELPVPRKTNLFFSRLTIVEAKQEIKDLLGIQEIKHFEIYLGLPSQVGRQKKRQVLMI